MLVPKAMPVMAFVPTVPDVLVTTPMSFVNDTLYVPSPLHIGCPTVKFGRVQVAGGGHDAGLVTLSTVLQLSGLVALAVKTTSVPIAMPVTLLPDIVPVLAVTPVTLL